MLVNQGDSVHENNKLLLLRLQVRIKVILEIDVVKSQDMFCKFFHFLLKIIGVSDLKPLRSDQFHFEKKKIS